MFISAAVLREKSGKYLIEEIEIDEPRSNEILVKITGAGMCHTDIFFKHNPVTLPIVLGHEGAGIVEKVGNEIRKVQPGDHVVLTYYSCGICLNCQQGHPAYCQNSVAGSFLGVRPDGTTTLHKGDEKIHGNFIGQSSFATYAIATERNLVKINKEVPIELMGPMGCGIQTGAGAVLNSLKAEAGTSIAVFGMGSVGLSAIMAAKIAGCTMIIGIDINDERLKLATELGATRTFNVKNCDAVQEVIKLTGGGADYSLESVGNPEVVRQAVKSIHRLGKCGIMGATPMETEVTLDLNSILFGRTVFGIIEGDSIPDVFIPRLVGMYMNGQLPIEKLVSYYTLDQINKAEEDSQQGAVLKPIIRM